MEILLILFTILACTAVLCHGICLIRKDIDELKKLIINNKEKLNKLKML